MGDPPSQCVHSAAVNGLDKPNLSFTPSHKDQCIPQKTTWPRPDFLQGVADNAWKLWA